MTPAFHDSIVYVDESGDHGPVSPEYPVFVLAFCVFKKSAYASHVTTAIQEFKFKYFGHDAVVLHEREIRKSNGPFSVLQNPQVRTPFLTDLTALIDDAPFTLITGVIRKDLLELSRRQGENPYHLAMRFCIERLVMHLHLKPGSDPVHVVFESRGKREDNELELEFRRCAANNKSGSNLPLRPVFASKQGNFAGMELADLIARPIGRHMLNPEQANRTWPVIERKLRRSPSGDIQGWGLKCFP
ncbi:MAG: DUF3800 domain-containing protein [Nannocystaceae bacterium]